MIVNSYSLLNKLILLYTITTLSYTLWPLASPNRIVGFMIFFCVLWMYCLRMDRKKLIILFACGVLAVFSMLLAVDLSRNITDAIYWILTIMLFVLVKEDCFLANINKIALYNRKWIKVTVIICNLLLTVGLFDSKCYGSESWGSKYFLGYTNAAHTLCAGVCLLMALVLYMLRFESRNIFKFVYLLPGIIAILQSGSRVFILSAIVIIVIYYMRYVGSKSIKVILFPIAIVMVVYLFLNSNMMTKFNFVIGNQYISSNPLAQITSGRTEFWKIDIEAFRDSAFFSFLFGHGFDYVYRINDMAYGLYIWSHNDLIDLLLSVGLTGTIVYMGVLFKQFKYNKQHIASKYVRILLIGYVILPILLNGFFGYQHYVYSYVFMLLACVDHDETNSSEIGYIF